MTTPYMGQPGGTGPYPLQGLPAAPFAAGGKWLDVSSDIQNTTLDTTTETLIFASIYPLPVTDQMAGLITGLTIIVFGVVDAGAAATGITVRARRGFGLTGQIDGEAANLAVTPGANSTFTCLFPINLDWLLPPSEGQYTISFQQVSATGNGTVQTGSGTVYAVAD